jgi:hypothetical protein
MWSLMASAAQCTDDDANVLLKSEGQARTCREGHGLYFRNAPTGHGCADDGEIVDDWSVTAGWFASHCQETCWLCCTDDDAGLAADLIAAGETPATCAEAQPFFYPDQEYCEGVNAWEHLGIPPEWFPNHCPATCGLCGGGDPAATDNDDSCVNDDAALAVESGGLLVSCAETKATVFPGQVDCNDETALFALAAGAGEIPPPSGWFAHVCPKSCASCTPLPKTKTIMGKRCFIHLKGEFIEGTIGLFVDKADICHVAKNASEPVIIERQCCSPTEYLFTKSVWSKWKELYEIFQFSLEFIIAINNIAMAVLATYHWNDWERSSKY